MLPLKYSSLKPIIEPHIRLIALSSKSTYGSTDVHEEHLVEKLNSFIDSLSQPEAFDMYDKARNIPYPDLDRERSDNGPIFSDITLKDTGRQNKGMEERFRKNLLNIQDLRSLTDVSTRYHTSMARGLERTLINAFNSLDAEAINRSTLKPI